MTTNPANPSKTTRRTVPGFVGFLAPTAFARNGGEVGAGVASVEGDGWCAGGAVSVGGGGVFGVFAASAVGASSLSCGGVADVGGSKAAGASAWTDDIRMSLMDGVL